VKRNALLIGGAVAVVIVLLWYFLLYAPLNDDLSSAQAQVAQEQKTTSDLQGQLAQLESQKQNGTQQQALLRRLDAAVPKEPDLAEFIIQANDIADQAGISFLSIAPSPPAAGNGGASVINLTITISGSFFQLEDYLRQLEQLERLVIVDGLNITASSGSSAGGTGAVTDETSSGTTLNVTLTGRMFTRAAPPASSGTGGTTTPSTPSTPSTSTPGESTTTTTTAGATTGGT
jgi:type IV pilus assembly protein PilO